MAAASVNRRVQLWRHLGQQQMPEVACYGLMDLQDELAHFLLFFLFFVTVQWSFVSICMWYTISHVCLYFFISIVYIHTCIAVSVFLTKRCVAVSADIVSVSVSRQPRL